MFQWHLYQLLLLSNSHCRLTGRVSDVWAVNMHRHRQVWIRWVRYIALGTYQRVPDEGIQVKQGYTKLAIALSQLQLCQVLGQRVVVLLDSCRELLDVLYDNQLLFLVQTDCVPRFRGCFFLLFSAGCKGE